MLTPLRLAPKLALPCVVSFVLTVAALGADDLTGKRVTIIRWGAEYRMGKTLMQRAELGDNDIVQKGDDKWLYVARRGGYVSRQDVVPYDEAIPYFTAEIKRAPTSENYRNRAVAYLKRAELNPAIKDFDESLKIDPKNSAAYVGRGNTWALIGDTARALADYDESIKLNPKYALAYNNRGSVWLSSGSFDKAIADFSESIRLEPTNSSALTNRGRAWHASGDFKKAVDDYTASLKLTPNDPLTLSARGLVWHDQEEFDKALADFDESLKSDPNSAEAYNSRGQTWMSKGDLEKALADHDAAIKLAPKYAAAYECRGSVYQEMGELKKAMADYDEAMRLAPKDPLAYNGLAWMLATSPDDSIRNGKRAVELAIAANALTGNEEVDYLDTLAAAQAESGDFDAAVATQQKIVDKVPAERKAEFTLRLELYKSKKPYRDAQAAEAVKPK